MLPAVIVGAGLLATGESKADTATNLLINGGFEVQDPAINPVPPTAKHTSAGQITGWQTSAPDGDIEIWSNGFTAPRPGYPIYVISPQQAAAIPDLFFPQGGGQFFAELNAKGFDTLSQNLNLPKTGLLSYSFWTQGRLGVDTLRFDIQKNVNGVWQTIHTQTFKTGTSPSGTDWTNYQGKNLFVGQKGQDYRIAVVSVDSSDGSPSLGNLVDNIAFGYIVASTPDFTTPPLAPNPGGGPLSPGNVQDQLGQTIGVAMTPAEINSAFLPRNTDAAAAGIQRYYNQLGLSLLSPDEWPQQIRECDGTGLNPRSYAYGASAANQAEFAPQCSCDNYKSSRRQFTFANDPRDYYGERYGMRAWVKGFSSSLTDINNPGLGTWNNRADVRGGGGILGVETSITPTTQLGLYGNAGGLSVTQTGNGGGNWNPTAYGVGLYGRWSPGPYFLAAQAGYGWMGGDQTRSVLLESETLQATGNKTADVFNTGVSAGARLRWGADTLITPSVLFNWANIQENGVNESGAGVFNAGQLFNLSYSPYASSWSNLDLGVTLSRAIRSGSTLVIPSFRVSWFGDWKTGGGNQTVNYSFSPQSVYVPGGWLDRNGVRLALGVDITTYRNTSVFVRGTADIGGNGYGGTVTDYGINGGLMVRFGSVGPKKHVASICPAVAPAPVPAPMPEPAPEPVRGLW